MSTKPVSQRHVSFNIFGGESLFHPNITEIIEYAVNKHKGNHTWSLGLNTVTNAIVKPKIWDNLIQYFDYLTVSYHTESTLVEQELFRRNVLELQRTDKRFQVSILLHPVNIQNCKEMIDWCKEHNVPYWARNMDTPPGKGSREQVITLVKRNEILKNHRPVRSCCGGQKFNIDSDYGKTVSLVPNNFMDWHCSVNQFFVFVKQETKEVFVNKDCLMSYDGDYGPIGTLNDTQSILKNLTDRIENGSDYLICKKERCWCGLCTPKAKDKLVFDDIMKKYHT
jgi:MoaA/NifB/PqqE/SkfB family radical SAM enzyme